MLRTFAFLLYVSAAQPAPPQRPSLPALPTIAPVTVTVPGAACPWLAGAAPGASIACGDRAPECAPVVLDTVAIVPGEWIEFEASGAVDHCPAIAPCDPSGPDGAPIMQHKEGGAENGIADAVMPINALVGVFYESDGPGPTPPPKSDFSDPHRRTETALRPLLRQPFFVGDGKNPGGRQRFLVPENAGRLALGVMDGTGWANNSGEFTVRVWPCAGVAAGPKSLETSVGSTAMFGITGTGNGPLTYSWFRVRNGNRKMLHDGPADSGSALSGTNTPTLTILNVGKADALEGSDGYGCEVLGSCGRARSRLATLKVRSN